MRKSIKELVSYKSAKEFAQSQNFVTIAEWENYFKTNRIIGFPQSPKEYKDEYTSAWEFLGYESEELYKAFKYRSMIENRDQQAINAKLKESWRFKREAKASKTKSLFDENTSKPNVTSEQTFTTEEVVNLLVSSDASLLFITEFIQSHKVNPTFAVETLCNLYKSKLAVTV